MQKLGETPRILTGTTCQQMKGSIMSNDVQATAARIAELKVLTAELDALKSRPHLDITKNGHIAIKGVRRFPICFKASELETVLEMFESGAVREFAVSSGVL